MTIQNVLVGIVLLIILCYGVFQTILKQKGGAIIAPFGFLNENIGQGIPSSYAERPNLPGGDLPSRLLLAPETEHPATTYYGNGVPLLTKAPGPIDNPLLLPHHNNPTCSPACCPSPYSCDNGCLCMDLTSLSKHYNGTHASILKYPNPITY